MPETDQGVTDFVLAGDVPPTLAQQRLADAEARGDDHAIAESHHAIQDAGGFDARAGARPCCSNWAFASSRSKRR
jgi:ATP-binding cassette subfamily F protein 3